MNPLKVSLGLALAGLTTFLTGPPVVQRVNPPLLCPDDMVHVSGDALDASSDFAEALQDMSCTSWISKEFPARCSGFDPLLWAHRRRSVKRKHLDFCIDRYEWPNREGAEPAVFITFYEAMDQCRAAGKRLCDEEEWTFACEGEEGMPYPHGYTRSPESCNVDRPWIEPDLMKLFSPSGPGAVETELNRLWQGKRSGEMTKCISSFGVHDMTGNVDEWTTSTRRSGFRSILKGGYWGPIRGRCRPSTRAHNEWHRFYQQGFRCCLDVE